MNYKKEAIIRSIKILDIGFITAIYFSLGLFLAKACDDVAGEFDEEKENQKPLWKIIIELIFYFWFIGIVIYVVRNVIPLIPFPLDGMFGFDHMMVKEVTNAMAFTITFIYFQKYYQAKIQHLLLRL
jgi:hypothetical protein